MKRWPLRQQLTAWSVLVVALAIVAFTIGAAWHSYEEDVELIDLVLKTQLRGVTAELKRHKDHLDWKSPEVLRETFPIEWRWRLIEVRREGKTLYRSEKLGERSLGSENLEPGYHSIDLDRLALRLAIARTKKWEIRVAAPIVEPQDSLRDLSRGFLLALPGVLLVTAFGGFWISRKALAPVEAITQAAERITASRLDQRLPVPPNRDEIQYLTRVLNGMIDRLEASLRQARRFSADASHELRTPLTIMRASLEDALSGGHLPAEQQEKLLLDLLDETTQLSAISTKLLLLSRADAGRLELDLKPTDLSRLVHEAAEEAEIIASDAGISIEALVPPEVTARVDAPRLLQVLRNLLENAVKYNRPQGRIRVELITESETARVKVANTGVGIAPKDAGHVFERFFRSEEHRSAFSGHGLGLSIAREIALAHGGDVALLSSDSEWTVFELRMPQAHSAPVTMATV